MTKPFRSRTGWSSSGAGTGKRSLSAWRSFDGWLLFGYELRRPKSDFLRDGIYELRARKGRVNYRVLYFFHGKNVALLAHALTKEDAVPDVDINRALERKKRYERSPEKHTYEESLDEQA